MKANSTCPPSLNTKILLTKSMEPQISLRTSRQPRSMQECRTLHQRPSTVQASWRSPMSWPSKKTTCLADFQNSSNRPHTTGGDCEQTAKNPDNSHYRMEGMTPLRTPHTFQDNWASSKVEKPQTINVDLRPLSTIQRPSTSHDPKIIRPSTKVNRPHTATGSFKTKSQSIQNVFPSNQTKKLQSVQSYSSPRIEGLSPPESPKGSVFDARSLKYPRTSKGSPKFDKRTQPSGVKPAYYLLDPSLNLRSPSISYDFKVSSDNPMDSLVTQMPLPPTLPSDSSTQSVSPSTESKLLRKQIEAALRMYPRNTWGPITKWGYLEELAAGKQHQKEHFIKNNDKLEKQRLKSRHFSHQRHWVDYKNLTNLWEPHEARQSTAYLEEKERFLTNSEKMLHNQNDKRIARAKIINKARRGKNTWREFKRLEKREGEYIDKIENEKRLRADGRMKSNDSGVVYNIVTLEYPNNYAGDLLRFEDDKISWRQCMRALRLQSRQSGGRVYNVLNWKPHQPCCVPSPKPIAPQPPNPDLFPSPRKPPTPLPKNMLHLEDRCDDVPIGCTNDLRTNW